MKHPFPNAIRYRFGLTFGLLSTTALPWGCTARILGPLPSAQTPPLAEIAPAAVDILEIPVSLPGEPSNGRGSPIAADVDGDEQLDILITQPEFIAAYSLTDGKLWEKKTDIWLSKQSESQGLPGRDGPGIQVSDIDGDGQLEVLYLTPANTLEVLSGESGERQQTVELPPVESALGHWEHAIVANFSGDGDSDLLLQASRPTIDRDNVSSSK